MVSLNTGLEIDLTGQIAAETMGFAQFSATGAQTETIQGAQLSPGGKSILALRSVYAARNAKGEKVLKSKIVPCFRPGTVVSTSRNDIDYVVTEYGVAWLRGGLGKGTGERTGQRGPSRLPGKTPGSGKGEGAGVKELTVDGGVAYAGQHPFYNISSTVFWIRSTKARMVFCFLAFSFL